MPSAIKPRDDSVHWPRCCECEHRHAVGTPCPPCGLWLVSGQDVDERYVVPATLDHGAQVGS